MVGSWTVIRIEFGGIAQLVERLVRNEKAWGSNPHTSTIQNSSTDELMSGPWFAQLKRFV
jgi:hypothetical protein